MDESQLNQRAVAGWLRQNAMPIRTLEPGNGFNDLLALKPLLDNVKIIGLGESTHGTREFFQLKHRLVDFLVLEMGFTVFTMEASYAAGHAINDYLLDGTGDQTEALSHLGYIAWDTEEFTALLDWLRNHNRHVPDERKVRFYGLDFTYNDSGRRDVMAYLGRVAPDRATMTGPIFRILAQEEAKWPMLIDDKSREAVKNVLPGLTDLMTFLEKNKAELVARSSTVELDRIVYLCRVMLERAASDDSRRSQHMGENLLALIDREIGDRKIAFWAHNYHVGVETFPDKEPTAGHVLRERFDDGYWALALEYGKGAYQARGLGPDGAPTDLRVVSVDPAPKGTLPWYLGHADGGHYIAELRAPAEDPAIATWLTTPLLAHAMGWIATDPESEYEPVSIRRRYDGIAFVERSTPVHPTATAMDNASRGPWF